MKGPVADLNKRAHGGVAPQDSRSDLPTRSELVAQLARRAKSSRGDALVLLEIADLKGVDEAYGSQCREAVLHIVGKRLASVVRSDDVVARYGNGEFAVLCCDCGVDEAMVVADRLRRATTEPLSVGRQRLGVSASVGVAHCEEATPGESMLERAEAALGRAKGAGTNRVELFTTAE